MSSHHSRSSTPLIRWFVGNTVLTGIFALLWLLLRSGPKPNRLAYPCQQAAFSTASLAFGAPLVAALITARNAAVRLLGDRRAVAVAAVGLFTTIVLAGFLSTGGASSSKAAQLSPPPGYRAEVFHLTDCPRQPVGDHYPGLDNLIALMGREGTKFYASPTVGPRSGPEGIISTDDVVVIKINYQWAGRGGTNTDLLRGLIRVIVDHPDGFTGEVVVGENTQTVSAGGFDRTANNAEDPSLSPLDVVTEFRQLGYAVSISDWSSFRNFRAEEGLSCDWGGGYVVLPPGPGGLVSYPKFRTDSGTCISLAKGIWDPSDERFERDRLKIINLPVLKPHGARYGITAAVKNFMGVVTVGLDTGSHSAVAGGLMGAVMAAIGMPDLSILDCIYVDGTPGAGPAVSTATAARLATLVASTDPIALDMWAASNILVPEFYARGYQPPWPGPDPDPYNPASAFRTYLDNSMNLILAGGYAVTNNLDDIDVHSWNGVPAPRRIGGRVGG